MTALCFNSQHRVWQQRLDREAREAARHRQLSSQSLSRLSTCGAAFPSNPNLLRDEAFHHLQSRHRIVSERRGWELPQEVRRDSASQRTVRKACDKSTQISLSRPSSSHRLSKRPLELDYDLLRAKLTNRLQQRGDLQPKSSLPDPNIETFPCSAASETTQEAEKRTVVSIGESWGATSSQKSLISHLERLLVVERKVKYMQKRVDVEERLKSVNFHRKTLSQ